MQICKKTFFFIKNVYASIFNFIHNFIYQKSIQNTSFPFTTFSLRKVTFHYKHVSELYR